MNILSLSYGKDSLACLGACEQLGIPIDRIVHAEVWATDTILADLPPMVEFKKHADKIIKERYGIEVEHICALKTQGWVVANEHTKTSSIRHLKKGGTQEAFTDSLQHSVLGAENSKWKQAVLTYEDMFYHHNKAKNQIQGFPISVNRGNWCTRLKLFRSQTVQVERERESRVHKSFKFLGLPQTSRNALSDSQSVMM